MNEVTDQVARSVVFENESVRVWDDRAAPGQTLHLHVHRLPYITVIIAGQQGETVDEEGGVQRRFEGLKRGAVHYTGPDEIPLVHAMRNTGSSELSVLIFELLK